MDQYIRQAVRIAHKHCFYCGGPPQTADHIIASAKGGADHPRNYIAACRRCNCKKSGGELPITIQREALVQAFILEPEVMKIAVGLKHTAIQNRGRGIQLSE